MSFFRVQNYHTCFLVSFFIQISYFFFSPSLSSSCASFCLQLPSISCHHTKECGMQRVAPQSAIYAIELDGERYRCKEARTFDDVLQRERATEAKVNESLSRKLAKQLRIVRAPRWLAIDATYVRCPLSQRGFSVHVRAAAAVQPSQQALLQSKATPDRLSQQITDSEFVLQQTSTNRNSLAVMHAWCVQQARCLVVSSVGKCVKKGKY